MPKRLDVTWTGLDALVSELRTLAPAMTADADPILLESAQRAQADIAAAYPVGATGHLRNGLAIEPAPRGGPNTAGARLVQRAPHGWIYEHGTKIRENAQGANRGATSPHPTFEPISETHQRRALLAIRARLTAHGAARVTGEVEPETRKR